MIKFRTSGYLGEKKTSWLTRNLGLIEDKINSNIRDKLIKLYNEVVLC